MTGTPSARAARPDSAVPPDPAAIAGASARRLRICLAASGGGHVRQLLDLETACAGHEVFFVSEETGLSRSISERCRTFFVDHAALGQARLGAPWRMVMASIRNFFQSARIVLRERPDVVISTGAGSVFFTVLWARLSGARIVIVESFARFDSLSMFARLAGPLAHEKVLQSAALSRFWPRAPVFDPMVTLDAARPPKQPLLFATVGATLPFDRLVASVDQLRRDGVITERVLVQTGEGGLKPAGVECHETLPFDRILATLDEADIVVCHGGTGSLITALRAGCRVVAMPRLFRNAEHYDDHQEEVTGAFAARGLISVAHTTEELSAAIVDWRERLPRMATSDPAALRSHVSRLLAQWAGDV